MGVGGSNNISNEKYINEAPIPVSMENTEKIIKQMKNCVCKIHKENKMGTGFFTKIPYNSNILPVLITNNHILDRDDIKCGNTITISLNNQKEFINIKIDESRKVFTDDNSGIDFDLNGLSGRHPSYKKGRADALQQKNPRSGLLLAEELLQ